MTRSGPSAPAARSFLIPRYGVTPTSVNGRVWNSLYQASTSSTYAFELNCFILLRSDQDCDEGPYERGPAPCFSSYVGLGSQQTSLSASGWNRSTWRQVGFETARRLRAERADVILTARNP